MSRRSERRWFIYERHWGWSLNPLTSQTRLFYHVSGIDPSSHRRFFSICQFFSPRFPLFSFRRLIAVNFLGRATRTGWWSLKIIMIILVMTCGVSRGCFARPFSFLLVWKGKKKDRARSCFARDTKNSRWSSNPAGTSLLLCSSRSWRAQDVDNEEIFRLIHVDRICVAFHRQSRKS